MVIPNPHCQEFTRGFKARDRGFFRRHLQVRRPERIFCFMRQVCFNNLIQLPEKSLYKNKAVVRYFYTHANRCSADFKPFSERLGHTSKWETTVIAQGLAYKLIVCY